MLLDGAVVGVEVAVVVFVVRFDVDRGNSTTKGIFEEEADAATVESFSMSAIVETCVVACDIAGNTLATDCGGDVKKAEEPSLCPESFVLLLLLPLAMLLEDPLVVVVVVGMRSAAFPSMLSSLLPPDTMNAVAGAEPNRFDGGGGGAGGAEKKSIVLSETPSVLV